MLYKIKKFVPINPDEWKTYCIHEILWESDKMTYPANHLRVVLMDNTGSGIDKYKRVGVSVTDYDDYIVTKSWQVKPDLSDFDEQLALALDAYNAVQMNVTHSGLIQLGFEY